MKDNLEQLLRELDRAAERREKARAQLDEARRDVVSTLRRAKDAGASFRKLAERLDVAPTEIVRLLSKTAANVRRKR